MRRPLHQQPDAVDFMSSVEYEASVPASFGLPEQPVLYCTVPSGSRQLYVVSDGLYVWDGEEGEIYDLDQVEIGCNCVYCDASTVVDIHPNYMSRFAVALARCKSLFTPPEDDSVELAEPLEFETGSADDLGDERLIRSVGQGHTELDGPNIARKRRRSSS